MKCALLSIAVGSNRPVSVMSCRIGEVPLQFDGHFFSLLDLERLEGLVSIVPSIDVLERADPQAVLDVFRLLMTLGWYSAVTPSVCRQIDGLIDIGLEGHSMPRACLAASPQLSRVLSLGIVVELHEAV